ncbi:MAG: phosphoenolpyruvate--protein phosphotransferase [Bacteroidota bacterium]
MEPLVEEKLKQEVVLQGIAAAPGIARGRVYLYSKHVPKVPDRTISTDDVQGEIERLHHAVARSQKELNKILSYAEQKLGLGKSKIFEAQIMILNDPLLFNAIETRIRDECKNAEFIINDEINKYQRLMLQANDEYMRERAYDVEELKNRILRNMQQERLHSRLEASAVIVAESLTSADTILFSRNDVLGYATDLGGVTSHAALLSRSLKIPAVMGLRDVTNKVSTGDEIVVDGYSGRLIIHPSKESVADFEAKRAKFLAFEEKLADLRDLPSETLDRKRIDLSVNIEFEDELEFARLQGAEGIGLYRTERLILERDAIPTEEEQYEEYKRIADKMYPYRVILRTFDIGGDKVLPQSLPEANPYLGWRGIRISLDEPQLFLDQLRAILRASARKNVAAMFPMVATVSEVREAKKMVEQAKAELQARGVPFDERMKLGVMIEVPSAAVMAEEISREVDFVSIGTNDLIQYLLAVDRTNSVVAGLYQEFHPAVLRSIKQIIDASHRSKVWVGMCGEMAGDPLAVILLVGLGLDEFSVVPAVLPEIKKIIRSIKYKEARRIAEKALKFSTEEEVEQYIREVIKEKFPEIPLG